MSSTVAKERIAEAMHMLEQARDTEDRVQLVGLIDIAKDELSAALKEAKQREGFKKKEREVKGQEKLPLTTEGRRTRKRKAEPEGITVTGDGVVVTPGDGAAPEAASEGEAPAEAATAPPVTNPDRCGHIRAGDNDRCIKSAFHEGEHEYVHRFSDGLPPEDALPDPEPATV